MGSTIENFYQQNECVICLEPLQDERDGDQCCETNCGHVFHVQCFTGYLRTSCAEHYLKPVESRLLTCPICREFLWQQTVKKIVDVTIRQVQHDRRLLQKQLQEAKLQQLALRVRGVFLNEHANQRTFHVRRQVWLLSSRLHSIVARLEALKRMKSTCVHNSLNSIDIMNVQLIRNEYNL